VEQVTERPEEMLPPLTEREFAEGRFVHAMIIAEMPSPIELWKWKQSLGIDVLPNLAVAIRIDPHSGGGRFQSDRQKFTHRKVLTKALRAVWPYMLAEWHEDLECIILLAVDMAAESALSPTEVNVQREVEQKLSAVKLPFGATIHAGLSHVVDGSTHLPTGIRAARNAAKHARELHKLVCLESDAEFFDRDEGYRDYSEYEEFEEKRAHQALQMTLSNDTKPQMIQEAIQYITSHLNEDLELEKIAAHCLVSHYYLSHLFRKETGQTVTAFIKKSRIDKAKELLKRPDYSVADVAYSVGFQDPNYFSKSFRSYVGITPTEFRSKIR
jgi:AraC-like DNA-binding protein